MKELLVVLHLFRHLIASLLEPAEIGIETVKLGLQQAELQFDGQQIDQDHSLQSLLFTHKAGDTVTLIILREGKTMTVKVTLGTRPAS